MYTDICISVFMLRTDTVEELELALVDWVNACCRLRSFRRSYVLATCVCTSVSEVVDVEGML